MNCGLAEVTITPPVGVWLQGYGARDRASEGVRDPLMLHCAVFEDSGNYAAIVRADLIAFSAESVERIRQGIEEKTPVKGDCVMLAATHTHSGPVIGAIKGMSNNADEKYPRSIELAAVEAVVSALGEMEPVEIGVAAGSVADLAYVREGPAEGDPSLTVMKVARAGTGEPLCLLVDYACHSVVLGGDNYHISADYPGVVRGFVEKELGAKLLFLQGACGDIDPVRGTSPADERLEHMGTAIGAEAIRIAEGAKASPAGKIASFVATAKLPAVQLKRDELQKMIDEAKAFNESLPDGQDTFYDRNDTFKRNESRVTLKWATEMLRALDAGEFPEHVECAVQVMRIGEAVLVGVAGEVFSEIGLAVKEVFGADRTFFVGYANGCIGYIPSLRSYDAVPYAVTMAPRWMGMPVLAKGAEKALLDEIKRLANAEGLLVPE